MNRLENFDLPSHKPSWPQRKPKPKPEPLDAKPSNSMTQIVGIVCKETVILASESQYTIGEYKVLEQPKMDYFTFKDGNQGLVALAGAVKAAKRTIELLKQTAKETNCETEEAAVEAIRDSIIKYRREVADFYHRSSDKLSVSEQDEIFGQTDRAFEITCAFAYGKDHFTKTPCLYKFTSFDGEPEKIKDYVVSGSGSHLATFILEKFQYVGMDWKSALPLVIDAIERIKRSDRSCGGKINVGLLHANMFNKVRIGFFPEDETNRVVQKLSKLTDDLHDWVKNKYELIMEEIHKENFEEHMARMNAEIAQENEWRKKAPGFSAAHKCSKCEGVFDMESSNLSADRKNVTCPKCGTVDQSNL